MRVQGLQSLRNRFRQMEMKLRQSKKGVVIGYSQEYALKVHEDTHARHAPGKQAKFLEEPARTNQQEIADIIAQTYKKTKDLGLSLMAGALYLLNLSQKIVPIDTGALRASGYVAYEKDANQVAETRRTASDEILKAHGR